MTSLSQFLKILFMKAFLTGGTGFIGSHLVDYLIQEGIEVYALVRNLNNPKWLAGSKAHLLEGDLFSIPDIPSDTNVVFHLAGLTKTYRPADYYTVNQKGTANLFDSLKKQNVNPQKTIYLSSLAVSGPSTEKNPVRESDPPKPVTHYGKSKLLGEKEALNYKDDYPLAIIRVGPVYGPRDKDFLPYFKLIKKGILPSIIPGRRKVTMCYVKDLIKAISLYVNKKDINSGEIFHIGNPHPVNWDEIGETAARCLKKQVKKIKVPLAFLWVASCGSSFAGRISKNPYALNLHKYRELKQEGWVADVRKAQQLLGFSSTYSLDEALAETINWYIENNWL